MFSSACRTTNSESGAGQVYPINGEHISKNYNSRIRQIVLHYTVIDFERSLSVLKGESGRSVSAHYLINDQLTEEYPDYIYQLLPDAKRAWHAGVSQWGMDGNVNNSSIGIEIVNRDGNLHPYPAEQMKAVVFLVKQLVERYNIDPVNVVGHSDVAPGRKIDPGSLFPWRMLYEQGIGAWYEEADIAALRTKIKKLPPVGQIKADLRGYGYRVNDTEDPDEAYKSVVSAFQRHFAPERVDGEMSLENYLILKALLKKYR